MSDEGYLLPAEVRALLLETDERIATLKRQRDAAVEALTKFARGQYPVGYVEKIAAAVLREIEGES